MSELKIKHKRDFDRPLIMRALHCFFICLFALLTLCIWTGGKLFTYWHFFIFLLCIIPFSILYAFVVEKAGSNGRHVVWMDCKRGQS